MAETPRRNTVSKVGLLFRGLGRTTRAGALQELEREDAQKRELEIANNARRLDQGKFLVTELLKGADNIAPDQFDAAIADIKASTGFDGSALAGMQAMAKENFASQHAGITAAIEDAILPDEIAASLSEENFPVTAEGAKERRAAFLKAAGEAGKTPNNELLELVAKSARLKKRIERASEPTAIQNMQTELNLIDESINNIRRVDKAEATKAVKDAATAGLESFNTDGEITTIDQATGAVRSRVQVEDDPNTQNFQLPDGKFTFVDMTSPDADAQVEALRTQGAVAVGTPTVQAQTVEGLSGFAGEGSGKTLAEGAQEAITGGFNMLTSLDKMEEGLGSTGLLTGLVTGPAASVGLGPGVAFDTERNNMINLAQSIIKGTPSDFDINNFIRTLPKFVMTVAGNQARIDVTRRAVKQMLHDRIAFAKGTNKVVPESVRQQAAAFGIKVDGIQAADVAEIITDPQSGQQIGYRNSKGQKIDAFGDTKRILESGAQEIEAIDKANPGPTAEQKARFEAALARRRARNGG